MNISILVASYNTPENFLNECVNSIKAQKGDFNIELVWINDGSNEANSQILETILQNFKSDKRNVVYKKLEVNRGLSYCLGEGVMLCRNEIIFRMDSDGIMISDRLEKQYKFITNTPDCVMCGADIICFSDVTKKTTDKSNHPHRLTWEDYKKDKKMWILNHPTLCFRRSAVISVGSYNKEFRLPFEDLDLEIRMLKKYGVLYNINEYLLLYRIHKDQVTIKNAMYSPQHNFIKQQMIDNYVEN